jgi:anti-anti-sigma regulatory factor
MADGRETYSIASSGEDRQFLVAKGSLTAVAGEVTSDAVSAAIETGARTIRIDMRAVTDVDPSGLAWLRAIRARLRWWGVELRIVNADQPHLWMLRTFS